MRLGIPRALLYYWYGSLWERFFQTAGFEVIISEPTDPETMAAGSRVGVDELCLPVKIFLGHALALEPKTDRILIPHLIMVEKGAYICPKFMGLPDLVSHALPSLKKKFLVLKLGPRETDMLKCLERFEGPSGASKIKIDPAWYQMDSPALGEVNSYRLSNTRRFQPKLTIGLLGHPYCLYDSCFNMNLLRILTDNGLSFVTPEMTPPSQKGAGAEKLPKRLFWTIGKAQFDALEWMLNGGTIRVDGFIQVIPFACGPEAMVGDLLERRIREAGKPVLKLYFEEHSGEAGIITRLEAFLDLIKYRSSAC